MRIIIIFIIAWFTCSVANAAGFAIQSTAFSNNERIPVVYTCNGKNISPPLSWSGAPANTKSFAIILSIPDAAFGGTFYSWVVFNIPATITELKEGGTNFPQEASTGSNSFGYTRYYGPCPRDAKEHHYVFTLYALDAQLTSPEDAEVTDVLDEIKKHVIETTKLEVIFSH